MTVTEPLITTQSKLFGHFEQNGCILAAAADSSAELKIDHDLVQRQMVGGLVGKGCEFVPRNRGRSTHVAPLLRIREGLWVWLGYREEWDEEPQAGATRRFSFRSVGLSIHFGVRNNAFKPQMFRAEWAGWAKWNSDDYSFQSGGAGHPHWQVDALDSLSDDVLSQRATQLLDRLKKEEKAEIHEFNPHLSDVDVRDVITVQKISRIHFASAASWWKTPPDDEFMHSPKDLADIQKWVKRCLEYVKLELNRL